MKIKDTESVRKDVEEYMKMAESNEDFKLSLQVAHLWADAMESNLEEIRNGDPRLYFAIYLYLKKKIFNGEVTNEQFFVAVGYLVEVWEYGWQLMKWTEKLVDLVDDAN